MPKRKRRPTDHTLWDLEAKLTLARLRLPWMREKVLKGAEEKARELARSADKTPREFPLMHMSADGNNWLCTAVVSEEHTRLYAVMWWNHGGQVDAIQVVPEGRAFHFYKHLFSQYRARLTKTRDITYNLIQFFKYNYELKAQHQNHKKDGRWAIAGVVKQGLVLGAVNGPHLISCKTYIPREQLNKRKLRLHDDLCALDGAQLPPAYCDELDRLMEE